MEREERLNFFVSAILSTARLLEGIYDTFFSKRLQILLRQFFIRGVGLFQAKEDDVAQYIIRQEFLQAIREINRLLEYLSYLNLVRRTPLLIARRSLMRLYLSEIRVLIVPKTETKTGQPGSRVSDSGQPTAEQDKISQIPKPRLDLNENQTKILGFIKKFERVRARDVIDQFSALSQRTVKRSLKELIKSGLIEKEAEARAVFYSPREG